jgi:hypothetical protein
MDFIISCVFFNMSVFSFSISWAHVHIPIELLDELATFITVQLDIPKEALHNYSSLLQATVILQYIYGRIEVIP